MKQVLCVLLSLLLALSGGGALASGIVLGGAPDEPAAEATAEPVVEATAGPAAQAQDAASSAPSPLAVEAQENGDALIAGASSPVAAEGMLYFVADGVVYAYAPGAAEAEARFALPQGVRLLGGETLWGFDAATGEVGPFTAAGAIDAQVQLDAAQLAAYAPYGVCRSGDFLWMLAYDAAAPTAGEEQLVRFDLTTGDSEVLSMPYALEIATYKDGGVLVLWQDLQRITDSMGTDLGIVVDAIDAQGAAAGNIALGLGAQMGGIAYDAQGDTLYCSGAGEIKQAQPDGTLQTVAYAPVTTSMTRPAAFAGGVYAVEGDDGLVLRAPGTVEASQRLTILGGLMDDTARAFMEETGAAVTFDFSRVLTSSEAVRNDMLSGASDVDIYVLNVLLGVQPLMEKHYLAPIESEALQADVASMYPQIAQALTMDGVLYAYPQQFQLVSWAVNEDACEAVGWTQPTPTTFSELLSQLALWEAEYAEQYPDYSYTQLYLGGTQLLSQALTQYALMYATDDAPLRFDTPAFVALLEQIEGMDLGEANAEEMSTEELMSSVMAALNREALIDTLTTDVLTVSDDATPRKRPIAPMVFTEGETPAIQASLSVYVLNPNSPRLDLAVQFLEYVSAHPDDRMRIALHPQEDEPARPADYEDKVAELQGEIDALSAQLETADAATTGELQDAIAQYESQLDVLEATYWAVSPDGIRYFRELAPYMTLGLNADFFFNAEDASATEALNDLLLRYLDGQLNAQQLVAELDQKLEMMYLEQM